MSAPAHLLSAGAPIEPPLRPVGHTTCRFVDPLRDQRQLIVDVWYPALAGEQPPARYEVLPGIAFHAAVAQRGDLQVDVFRHHVNGLIGKITLFTKF